MAFKVAKREQALLRLGISGPTGSGKTYSSLAIAKGIMNSIDLSNYKNPSIGFLDSEQRSSLFYAKRNESDTEGFEFLHNELTSSDPDIYIAAINEAKAMGIPVLIIDSLTHAWNFINDYNQKIADTKFKGNTWSAWSITTPRYYTPLVNAILTYPGHVIATFRSKTESAMEEHDGKKSVKKYGMKTQFKVDIEYEFSMFFEIDNNNTAHCTKDRTKLLYDKFIERPGEEIGAFIINDLLNADVGEAPPVGLIDGSATTPPPLKKTTPTSFPATGKKPAATEPETPESIAKKNLDFLQKALEEAKTALDLDRIKTKTIPGWEQKFSSGKIVETTYKQGKVKIDEATKYITLQISNASNDYVSMNFPLEDPEQLEIQIKNTIAISIEQGEFEPIEELLKVWKNHSKSLPNKKWAEINNMLSDAAKKMGIAA